MLGNVSKPTIYNWIKTRKFPPPIRIGANTVIWRPEYVRRWIAEQERAAA
jgi:predicted DNA-binding transcriptional regulator AlpA